MNQAELQKLVEEISLQYFHVPFKHEVKLIIEWQRRAEDTFKGSSYWY